MLLDHVAAARRGLRAWLGERATPVFEDAWFAAEDVRVAEWRAGATTWPEQRRNRLRDVLPLLGEPTGSDDDLDRIFEDGYLPAYRASWSAFADARPAVDAMRASGLLLGVLTNGAESQQRDKLRAIGLLDDVGPVLTAEGIGLSKPDPRAFTTACERLDVRALETVFVGDDHEVDVLGARAAGLRAVLLDRDGSAPAEEHVVIRALTDLPELLASDRMEA